MTSDKENNNNKEPQQYKMGSRIAIGIGIGVALGVALDNIALGIAMGVAIGVASGASLKKKNNSNKNDN